MMLQQILKRDTLFARIAGMFILTLLLVQYVTYSLVHIEVEHLPARSELTERIASSFRALDANSVPPELRPALAQELSTQDLGIKICTAAEIESHDPSSHPGAAASAGPPDERFEARLKERLGNRKPFHILRFWRPATTGAQQSAEDQPSADEAAPLVVAISLHDGDYAEFHPQHIPIAFRWLQDGTWIATIFVVSSVLSLWFARRLSRGLARFANAAEELGRTTEAPPLPETGPLELRLATRAFNRMQERLRRFVHDRTQMLAAISHDLRTPLTRMRLRAEFVEDDEQRTKMLYDIGQMESMISETLAFARDDITREPRREEDLDELLDHLAESMGETGQEVRYDAVGPVPIRCSPTALRRAFANLVENAIKYGHRARLRLSQTQGHVLIEIDDDGPGIPAAMQDTVFQPFFRLESSRNRDTGGVGLGLSVARTIIRGHGGDIVLANRPEGGLRAAVTLPA
jgi:signal transduction histidine kinase